MVFCRPKYTKTDNLVPIEVSPHIPDQSNRTTDCLLCQRPIARLLVLLSGILKKKILIREFSDNALKS